MAAKQWVMQVALGPEFGGGGKTCARFVGPITLSVMQRSASERVHLLELIPLLDRELRASGEAKRHQAQALATTLSELDKKLVRFHYRHVQPGFGQRDLEVAFDRYWQQLP